MNQGFLSLSHRIPSNSKEGKISPNGENIPNMGYVLSSLWYLSEKEGTISLFWVQRKSIIQVYINTTPRINEKVNKCLGVLNYILNSELYIKAMT